MKGEETIKKKKKKRGSKAEERRVKQLQQEG